MSVQPKYSRILCINITPMKASTFPSLASIFPFLEGVCARDSPTWHISRARLLDCFVAGWVRYTRTESPAETSLISVVSCSGTGLVNRDAQDMHGGVTKDDVSEYDHLLFLLP